MLELKNVSKYYNNNGVVTLGLRNINLNFDKNEIVAIVGESGSGKSTLLNVICAGDTYEDGEILFEGYETSYFNKEDMDTFRRQNVSFIYQNYNIIDSYTVLENVMFPLLIKGLTYKEAKEKALKLIEEVGLSNRVNNRGIKLSGGEKQRCVIARALATDSPILACDEPTGNLDSKTGEDIIKLIKKVAKDKLVLIVTHNYEQVEGIVTRTITMADGEVVSDTNINKNNTKEVKDGDLLDDENKKINFKILSLIALNNLRRTPKKNLFVFLVLFVLSVIGLFLILLCYDTNTTATYNSFDGYSYSARDRIIVYDENHNTFDKSLFSDFDGMVNAFYEDDTSFYLSNDSYNKPSISSCNISHHIPSSTKDINGSMELNNNQGFIVFPSNYYLDSKERKSMLNVQYGLMVNNFTFDSSYLGFSKRKTYVKIVGYGTCDEINSPALILNKSYIETLDLYSCRVESGFLNLNNGLKREADVYFSNEVAKPKLYIHDSLDLKNIEISIKGIYNIEVLDYEVINDNVINGKEATVVVPLNTLKDNCFEYSISTDDIQSVINVAKANNLSTIIPSQMGYNVISFEFMTFLVSLVFSIIAMLILVFITYIVLQKVYQSRSKDYAIMRSLGVMRPQMANVLRLEISSLGMASAVLSIITFFIINTIMGSIGKGYAVFPAWVFILYFVLMFLFYLALANRFNKKLFKFSIAKAIKEVF